jgi:hypothetical protein
MEAAQWSAPPWWTWGFGVHAPVWNNCSWATISKQHVPLITSALPGHCRWNRATNTALQARLDITAQKCHYHHTAPRVTESTRELQNPTRPSTLLSSRLLRHRMAFRHRPSEGLKYVALGALLGSVLPRVSAACSSGVGVMPLAIMVVMCSAATGGLQR